MLVWILFALAGFFSPLDSTTGDQEDHEPLVIEGRTMGTTYRVIYFDPGRRRDFSASVDSLLVVVNEAINTYNAASDISRFNKEKRGICMTTPYLYQVLKVARKIHDLSDGAFDPTVMPLVNAWGFGPQKDSRPSPQEIDSLRKLVGFDQIKFSKKRVWKTRPHVQLDMGGIGQGFGADVIAGFLKHKGIRNMLVELGGEGVAFGKNLQKEKPWTIGILNPHSTPVHQYFKAYVTLGDRAFTTSGNYFNYKVIDGRKYGHTLDPRLGEPVQHSLLSASVFAPDCTTADGLATAFMVMGVSKAIETSQNLKGVDVLFIYNNEDGELQTYVSPGFRDHVTLE